MTPLIIAELVKEALRLANNLLEGTPVEQRRANAVIWFNTTWPLFKGLFPLETQKQVEEIMKNVK